MAHTHHIQTGEIPKPNTAGIWKTFWILLAVTALEFIVALAVPDYVLSRGIKVFLYIIMTIAKAAYIVGSFMHLWGEVKFLQNTLIFPLAFIVWLLGACFWEGGSLFSLQEKSHVGGKGQKEAPKTEEKAKPAEGH